MARVYGTIGCLSLLLGRLREGDVSFLNSMQDIISFNTDFADRVNMIRAKTRGELIAEIASLKSRLDERSSEYDQVLRTNYALFMLLNRMIERSRSPFNHHWGARRIYVSSIVLMVRDKPDGQFQYCEVLTPDAVCGYIESHPKVFNPPKHNGYRMCYFIVADSDSRTAASSPQDAPLLGSPRLRPGTSGEEAVAKHLVLLSCTTEASFG